MSDDLRLIEQSITAELTEIGIEVALVSLHALDDLSSAYIIKIISHTFDGLTYLDREMRVRPAIARALSRAGQPRSEFVVEPLSPEDSLEIRPFNETTSRDDDEAETTSETSPNRARWRTEIDLILKALRDSSYEIEPLSDGSLYRANRAIVSEESLLIGFAQSVSAKTVDVDVRKSMQNGRNAQKTSECYYLSSRLLAAPFANQTRANWLKLETTTSFLHLLNSSRNLAKKLSAELAGVNARVAAEHQGRVIEPDIKDISSGLFRGGFFSYTKEWLQRPGPSLLVVMAPAGHGKTTLSQELSRRMAASFLTDGAPRPVPVMVPFESVRRVVDFESLLFRRLGELRPGSLGAFLPLLHRGEAVLVVDGFDELANDAGFEVAENQVRSMKFLFSGNSRVVLAGRSLFTEDFADSTTIRKRMRDLLGDIDVDVAEILPFSEHNIAEYVDTRDQLTLSQKQAVITFSQASPDHEQLSSNPLFLKILCSLAAADGLPVTTEIGTSVELLIRHVCEREETRQHLGIGTEGQLKFLRWVALEIMGTGKGVLRPDLEAMAQLSEPPSATHDAGVVGRLIDHALLDKRGADRVDLIHPYIRDILIGGLVLSEVSAGHFDTAAVRDLPEASVHHVASLISEAAFPVGWLSAGSPLITSRVRRNLFRVAIAKAEKEGDPRSWLRPAWLTGDIVRALDLSSLRLRFLSFDNVKFNVCDFSRSVIEECDIRSAQFLSCTFAHALLQECRADEHLIVERGNFDGTVVIVNGTNVVADSPIVFRDCVAGVTPLVGSPLLIQAAPEALQRIHALLRDCLFQFVETDPTPKFFIKREDELENVGTTDREKLTVERVLAPGVYSRLCSVGLAGGSVKTFTLDKRYYTIVVDFLRTGVLGPSLSDLLGPIIMRGTRFLS